MHKLFGIMGGYRDCHFGGFMNITIASLIDISIFFSQNFFIIFDF